MLKLYTERKTYNELRVRVNVAPESDIVNALTWSGHRIDEFVVTDDEAEAIGFPTPTFGEGVAFAVPQEKEEQIEGCLSVLRKLIDGPRLLDYPWLPEVGEFANWLFRVTYDEKALVELTEWTIFPCDEHFHLASRAADGEEEKIYHSKLGFSIMSVLSLLEQEMAELVALENGEVEDEVSEDDLEHTAIGEFLLELFDESDDEEVDSEHPDGWEAV